jgi:hypothetical protein
MNYILVEPRHPGEGSDTPTIGIMKSYAVRTRLSLLYVFRCDAFVTIFRQCWSSVTDSSYTGSKFLRLLQRHRVKPEQLTLTDHTQIEPIRFGMPLALGKMSRVWCRFQYGQIGDKRRPTVLRTRRVCRTPLGNTVNSRPWQRLSSWSSIATT